MILLCVSAATIGIIENNDDLEGFRKVAGDSNGKYYRGRHVRRTLLCRIYSSFTHEAAHRGT